MTLAERITENMKAAMKAKNSATLSTLRLLLSAMKNKKIDVQHELSDAEVQDVVKTQVKQLKDSIESFKAGGREDLVTNTQAEIVVLEQYLPVQMSDEELAQIVKNVLEKSGATSKTDMGKVMGAAMAAVAGRADGSRVKDIVGTLLASFVLVVVGLSFSQEAIAAVPLIENFSTGPAYFEFILRIVRVLVLWLGVLAIVPILVGGFKYMVASNGDDRQKEALEYVIKGVFVSVVVFLAFSLSTVVLQKI